MINVVVIDDHAVVREGLKRIISENPGMAVSGEAGDGYEAMKSCIIAPYGAAKRSRRVTFPDLSVTP